MFFRSCRNCNLYILSLVDMTSTQIEAENTQLINDLYRLLKRYTGLRNLIKELTVSNEWLFETIIMYGVCL